MARAHLDGTCRLARPECQKPRSRILVLHSKDFSFFFFLTWQQGAEQGLQPHHNGQVRPCQPPCLLRDCACARARACERRGRGAHYRKLGTVETLAYITARAAGGGAQAAGTLAHIGCPGAIPCAAAYPLWIPMHAVAALWRRLAVCYAVRVPRSCKTFTPPARLPCSCARSSRGTGPGRGS